MTALLPLTPSVEHLRKQAKVLYHRCRANERAAIEQVLMYVPELRSPVAPMTGFTIRLSDTQLATAREYGFQNWGCLGTYVRSKYPQSAAPLSPIDDSRFSQIEFRSEVARQKGLPAIGTVTSNRYGVKYQVVDYQPSVSLARQSRISRGGPISHVDDLLPIIYFPEMSSRLERFCVETDWSTTKRLMFLDTMPGLHPEIAAPGLNEVCTLSDPSMLQFRFDAENLHETIIAHELGHIWIEKIEGCEDFRHLRDQSNSAKVSQFQHIQSFVLDLRVNELLQQRGFDISIIRAHQSKSILNIANHCARGERPRTIRAAAGLINTLASVMIVQRCASRRPESDLSLELEVIEIGLPEVFEAATKYAGSVHRHGYTDSASVQRVVDECARLSFALTGDAFDPDRDLVEIPPTECMDDKHPDFLPDLPVSAKLELLRTVVRCDIAGRAQFSYNTDSSGRCEVSITTREGSAIDPIIVNLQVPPPARNEWQHMNQPFPVRNPASELFGTPSASPPPHRLSHVGASSMDLAGRQRMNGPAPGRTQGQSHGIPHHAQPPQPVQSNLRVLSTSEALLQEHFGAPSPGSIPAQYYSGPNTVPSWPEPIAIGKSRSYSAGLGVWLSEVGFEQRAMGEKPYGYANNNPVTTIDPSGLSPCLPAGDDPCAKYKAEPGFWDNLGSSIGKAAAECPAYNQKQITAILRCIVENESRDHPKPYKYATKGSDVQGPCQLAPGKDKDSICAGINWRNSVEEHLLCCAKVLCKCLTKSGGNLVIGCGTTGTGEDRTGQFQVINQSGSGYDPRFKCCLIRQGIPNPSQTIPTIQTPPKR